MVGEASDGFWTFREAGHPYPRFTAEADGEREPVALLDTATEVLTLRDGRTLRWGASPQAPDWSALVADPEIELMRFHAARGRQPPRRAGRRSGGRHRARGRLGAGAAGRLPRHPSGRARARPGAAEDELTMATLYRCITPTDWLCPCGTVARALRRAKVEHEQVRVPFRQADRGEIDALTGQRHVPVLVIGGEAICDSKRILEHLEWRAAGGRDAA